MHDIFFINQLKYSLVSTLIYIGDFRKNADITFSLNLIVRIMYSELVMYVIFVYVDTKKKITVNI